MPKIRVTRELSEMIIRLEKQLELLSSHSIQAFENGRREYYGEVATKLRLLLVRTGRSNTPLLFELADRLEVPLEVTLGGPPVRPPVDEPGPGETVSLDQFFDLAAVFIRTKAGLIPISKCKLICAWCEKLGGAHEDWAIPESIINAIEFPVLPNGINVPAVELRNCAKITLQYGDKLLHQIAHSPDTPTFLTTGVALGDQPDQATRVARQYGRFGNFMRVRGNLEGAERMYREALGIFERIRQIEGIASSYNNLGIILGMRNDLDGAEAMFHKALAIYQGQGSTESTAELYGNLANIIRDRGDLDHAERMYWKALDIHEQLGLLEGMAVNYGNLGIARLNRGDLDGAERMYRKALQIDGRLGRHEGMANQYANIGEVMAGRNDVEGAREMWKSARDLFARIGNKNMAQVVQSWIDNLPS